MKTILLAKQCLPLLTADNQLQDWFAPVAMILFIFGVIAMFRASGKAQSRARLNSGVIAGLFVGCVVLLAGGWLMSQFFTPIC